MDELLVKAELWRRGELSWKLKDAQVRIVQTLNESGQSRKFVIHCSRRLGKSYLLCILALTVCLSQSNAQVRYAAPTQKAVRKIIHPIVKDILKDCPSELKPRWNSTDGCYNFHNGSQLHVAGVNNGHEDDLRGTDAHLAIVDEAGFVDSLKYVVDSVLTPQLINTGGRLIMSSSSPLSPAHEFVDYIHKAKADGSYSKFTIYDAGYPDDLVEEFKKEAGGEHSTTWLREYLCELIVDEQMSVVPEWSGQYVQEFEHDEFYEFYHKYESMDVGVRDNTAILFGHYDFTKATLFIEREFIINGVETTTRNIATAVDEVEAELNWGKPRRIADNNNLVLLNDLGKEFGKHFQPTTKESKSAMINQVRLMVQDGRIIVHPRCENLIGCLEFGVFKDKSRNEFGRSDVYGHYDALDALIYLVRNLDTVTNPIPATAGIRGEHLHRYYIPETTRSKDEQCRKLFKPRS